MDSSEATQPSQPRQRSGFLHTLSRLRSYFILDPLIFLYTAVLGMCSLTVSFFEREGRAQHWFAWLWSWLILKTSMSPLEVIGAEKIDKKVAAVYAANHISAMDIPVLYTGVPVPFRIVANKELFTRPFVGWHLTRSGQIPIDRSSPRATFKSLVGAIDDLKKGLSVAIFPEGGRSRTGEMQPFMNGAFYVAVKAQSPIVPLAIVGTYEMLPMDTFHIMPYRLKLVIGDPISTVGKTTHDLEELAGLVRAQIAAMYAQHHTT